MLSVSGRRALSLASYTLGLFLGASITISVAVAVALPIQQVIPSTVVQPLLVLVATILFIAHDLRLISLPLWQNARLVPQTVFRFGPIVGAWQFGVEMGSGVRTYITSAFAYMPVVLMLLVPLSWLIPLGAAVGFALGRGSMALVSVASGDTSGWVGTFNRASTSRVLLQFGAGTVVAGLALAQFA